MLIKHHNKNLLTAIFSFGFIFILAFSAAAQKSSKQKTAAAPVTRAVTIVTEPAATVWLDDVKRGRTGDGGKLEIKFSLPGTRKLRVRADGFKEASLNLLPAQKGEVKVALVKTNDEAELAFQQAEKLSAGDKSKAEDLYEKAVKLRPNYAEAYLGLARLLTEEGDYEGALQAIEAARKARPGYAEASAAEGRIHKAEGNEEKAVAAFKRAIAEGKNFQPEAHTGLGLFYKEKAEGFGAAGQFDEEEKFYLLAADEFTKAVKQLSGAPDAEVLYQFLGLAYEKIKRYKEAINVYEDFLRVFPDSSEASAVRSYIVQIKKQMN